MLRSFRLVRVLRIGKLVSMFPQIQRQLKVIQKTLSTVSSLIGLITLFLLIFAILGMTLFGNRAICEIDSEDADGVYMNVYITLMCVHTIGVLMWGALCFCICEIDSEDVDGVYMYWYIRYDVSITLVILTSYLLYSHHIF